MAQDPNSTLPELQLRPAAPAPTGPEPSSLPPEPVEDAGTQALSEALSSSFRIIKVLMAALVAVFFCSGVFTVNPNEVAVVLRFGVPRGTGAEQLLKPGLHWAFPYPVDEIVRIPVGQSQSTVSTAGWYAISAEEQAQGVEPSPLPYLRPGVDGYTLTADGNTMHVRATIKYRISDPIQYAFQFASFTNLLENVVNNALYHASSRFSAESAIYKNKTGFKEAVLAHVVEGIDRYKLGITLEPSEVETSAPLEVRRAFDEVLAAEQERGKKISEAQGTRDEITRKAVGEAQAVLSEGITSSNRLVQAVSAEASYFREQLPNYVNNPQLFTEMARIDTLQRVLTNAQEKMFIPARADGTRRQLRLQLSREPQKPATLPQAQ